MWRPALSVVANQGRRWRPMNRKEKKRKERKQIEREMGLLNLNASPTWRWGCGDGEIVKGNEEEQRK